TRSITRRSSGWARGCARSPGPRTASSRAWRWRTGTPSCSVSSGIRRIWSITMPRHARSSPPWCTPRDSGCADERRSDLPRRLTAHLPTRRRVAQDRLLHSTLAFQLLEMGLHRHGSHAVECRRHVDVHALDDVGDGARPGAQHVQDLALALMTMLDVFGDPRLGIVDDGAVGRINSA